MSTGHYTSAPSGQRTGFWRRFAAVFLDGIVIASVTTILYALSKTGSFVLSLLITLAYYTAFAIAAATPTIPISPSPLMPIGLTVPSCSSTKMTSMSCTSASITMY